jgi:hypothetical protein
MTMEKNKGDEFAFDSEFYSQPKKTTRIPEPFIPSTAIFDSGIAPPKSIKKTSHPHP